ncbi:methyltransferase [Kocuria indica]|uniref:Methyltransferase n=1 Tax=Kocuria marina subsp. indica TaxID=1049583 RepID=A0A6N9QZD5_9MICC|nr:methyltransferase [Kocuria indica]
MNPHDSARQDSARHDGATAHHAGSSDTAPAFSTVPDAPRSDDPALIARLHADLVAAGFTVDGVTDLVGEQAMSAWSRDQAVPARRALQRRSRELGSASGRAGDAHESELRHTEEPHDPADHDVASLITLAAFFLLGDPVSATALDAALPSVGARGLERLGLVEAGASTELRSAVDLRPYATDSSAELYVASDLGAFQRPGVLRHDHVLGIGGASLTLVQSTPRRPVDTALDLGTGCGIQTFHLLAHARHVTATDISDRALATARFNLILNAEALDVDPWDLPARVSLERGSLLEPVVGRQFDMVVSNPPFVITPRNPEEHAEDRFTYRDGGLPGDRLVRELLGALPSVLNPGATAHLLANWEIPRDPHEEPSTTWSRGPASWVPQGTGAWIIQRELQDPCEYAETWLRDASQQRDVADYERAYAAYLDDFDSRDVAAVGFGMVWLYRPQESGAQESGVQDTAPRIFETIPHAIQQPIAPALAAEWDRVLSMASDEARDAHDPGATSDTASAWLARHYTVAQDVTEERHGTPGAPDPALILLRQGAGLCRSVILSSEAAGFAGVCDGELSAGQILTALGSLLEWQDGPAPQLLREIKGLITHGFLVEV